MAMYFYDALHKRFIKATDGTVVGRDSRYAKFASDAQLSHEHWRFHWKRSHCSIEDLSSTNGTKLNGVRLATRAVTKVSIGDRVDFGNQQLIFAGGVKKIPGSPSPAIIHGESWWILGAILVWVAIFASFFSKELFSLGLPWKKIDVLPLLLVIFGGSGIAVLGLHHRLFCKAKRGKLVGILVIAFAGISFFLVSTVLILTTGLQERITVNKIWHVCMIQNREDLCGIQFQSRYVKSVYRRMPATLRLEMKESHPRVRFPS